MEGFIPTNGSLTKSCAGQGFVCVNYQDTRMKRNGITFKQDTIYDGTDRKQMREHKEKDLKRQQELEMKAARYDVIKYGMSGFEKRKEKAAKIGIAVNLGAKPPRNRRMNYKHLKTMRKNAKEHMKDEKVSNSSKRTLKNVKKAPKKRSIKILNTYGTIDRNILVKGKS